MAPAIVLMASACSKSDLDRDAARQIIASSAQVQGLTASVRTVAGYRDEGLSQGLWVVEDNSPRLLDRAAKEISQLSDDHMVPSSPISIDISVMGIREPAEGSKSRSVEFSWSYEGLSPLVKRFALKGGTGSATIDLYDDGWRLSDITLDTIPERVTLSDSEGQAVANDVTNENARKENERKRVIESIIPTKIRNTLSGVYYNAPHKIAIADNGVIFYSETLDKSNWGTGKFKVSGFLWFGKMDNPRLGKWGVEYDFPSLRGPSINPERIGTSMSGIDPEALLSAIRSALGDWQKKYADIPLPVRHSYLNEANEVWRQSPILSN